MTTKESISEIIRYRENKKVVQKPIYEIMMFQHPNKELVYPTGKHSGFPDIGASMTGGFYYEIETAIKAINENWCDLRETIYDAGFVLCHFPGLYETAGTDLRMYFVWDEDTQSYIQKEEPKIFAHIAY